MRYLFLLLLPVFIFAGQARIWTGAFVLNDPNYAGITAQNRALAPVFKFAANPNPFTPSTVLSVKGFIPGAKNTLRIFSTIGKLMADLTPELHSGATFIAWKPSGIPTGIYLARLQNGKRIENLKLVLIR